MYWDTTLTAYQFVNGCSTWN